MGVAMQIKVSKSKAIERLSALRDAVEGLRFANAESPGFLRWQKDLEGTFKHVFGEQSSEMKDCSMLYFRPISWNMNCSENARAENERNATDAYQSGLDKAYALIASIIGQIEDFWEDDSASAASGTQSQSVGSTDSNQVFVVHGRDQGALSEVKLALIQLGLEPVILQELPDQGRTIIEKFEDYSQVGFAVILCTPDDDGRLAVDDSEPHPRARQNVVFEWGFFIGKLGRRRVCALIKGKVEIHSDYDGVLYVEMDDGEAWKIKLVRELQAAEYAVDANKLV